MAPRPQLLIWPKTKVICLFGINDILDCILKIIVMYPCSTFTCTSIYSGDDEYYYHY